MNRIILIGNGFDLAHGLETGYKQFIDCFWRKIIVEEFNKCGRVENDFLTIDAGFRYDESVYIPDYQSFKERLSFSNVQIKFKNNFLKIISENLLSKLQNWVDIEEEYYKLLQKIINKSIPSNEKTYTNIKQLNDDFCRIKKALATYLIEETTKGIGGNAIEFVDNTINENIYSEFELRDFTREGVEQIVNETIKKAQYCLENKDKLEKSADIDIRTQRLLRLQKKDTDYLREKILDCPKGFFHLIPDSVLFLNFNYSNTEELYSKQKYEVSKGVYTTELRINRETIHIHGELENSGNPIIFGYGDEIGKEYAEIENLNDNEFLENIKSIRYSDTGNYKKLLDYINSDKYQIFLFGHSCGLSDRTLLNTLFEHENCVSIKLFYHKKEDGTDNYSDVVRNISRHFKDKTLMRSKIVNKEYSKPLS